MSENPWFGVHWMSLATNESSANSLPSLASLRLTPTDASPSRTVPT